MSIREAIESAVNTAEQAQVVPETPAAVPVVETPAATPVAAPVETEEQKAGRTAGRSRDEHGRLLPGKAEKPPVQAQPQVAQVEIAKPKAPPPPSSWKKEHWESWEKIALENPQLAEYLNQREGEFTKGVSTYKQEYENVRPLAEAVQPFLPTLQQHGINPAQWITNLGQAHHTLALGNPQQKLQMFQKLAQDYQVPLQVLYDPQAQQQFLMQQVNQPQVPQPDVKALVQEQLTEVFAKHDLEQFQAEKDASGNPLYPHYEMVRDDMALLLESGKAQDLKSAYYKAIRLNDDIWETEQQAKQAAAQKATQIVQAKQVAQAKAAAVSTKTATPSPGAASATKGIRDTIEASIDAHSSGGRV